MENGKVALTREQLEIVKKDRSHIAIQTLDSLGARYWEDFYINLGKSKTGTEALDLCGKAFIPFADTLEGKNFTLTPLEIVSIWARAMELFPERIYSRYSLSTSLACVYGTMQIASPEWRNLYRKEIIERSYLRKLAEKDRVNALNFRNRLSEIDANLRELKFYRNGTKDDVITLAKHAVKGDAEAIKKLENIERHQKEHDGEFIGEITENWGNGMFCLAF